MNSYLVIFFSNLKYELELEIKRNSHAENLKKQILKELKGKQGLIYFRHLKAKYGQIYEVTAERFDLLDQINVPRDVKAWLNLLGYHLYED